MIDEKTKINDKNIPLSSPRALKHENETVIAKENEFIKEKNAINSNLSTESASNKKTFYKKLSNTKEISRFKTNTPSTNTKKNSLNQNHFRSSKIDRNDANKKTNKIIESKNFKKNNTNNSSTIPQSKISKTLPDTINNPKHNANKTDNNIKINHKDLLKECSSKMNKTKENKLKTKQNEKDEKNTNTHNKLKISEEVKSPLKKKSNNINKFQVINKPFKPRKLGSSLYIPHVVLDPLDIIKTKLNKVLKGFNDKIINISQSSSMLDITMQTNFAQIYDDYTAELQEIYRQKENKLMEIDDKYEQVLYQMLEEYGDKDNILYDELLKEKEELLANIEKDFINSKKELKLKFKNKIEELKKNTEENKQKMINEEIVDDFKKQVNDIFIRKEENLTERKCQSNYKRKIKNFDTNKIDIKEAMKIK